MVEHINKLKEDWREEERSKKMMAYWGLKSEETIKEGKVEEKKKEVRGGLKIEEKKEVAWEEYQGKKGRIM